MAEELYSDSKKDKTIGDQLGGKGGSYPIVEINGYNLSDKQISTFELNTEGFLPKVHVSFKILDGTFISTSFPKDGDLISVFIRSLTKDLKPIRADFVITKVITSKSKDPEGERMRITVVGDLNVPKIHASFIKSYSTKTSFEVMVDIANELGLGLVINQTDSLECKDTMTWISPNFTYEEFIQAVTTHAYLDEYAFFNSWIDYYYNLNFVDLNKMYSIADTADTADGILSSIMSSDFTPEKKIDYIKERNILTNIADAKYGRNYISKYAFLNSSGEINKNIGYLNNVNFFDFELGEHVNFDIEATVTDSESKKISLKGRPHEDSYKDEVKKIWNGWSYSKDNHNHHEFYKESYYQNLINNNQINKLRLKVYLDGINMNYYQGQRVPMIFTNTMTTHRMAEGAYEADKVVENDTGFTIDRFLSGSYIVQSINLIYKTDIAGNRIWSQEMIMTRREWTHPKITDPAND